MENQHYPKRPIWQWVAIYAVLGAVVYGAVYYFFLAEKTGYSSTTAPAPTALLTPSGFVPSDLTIQAGTHVTWTNQSGVTGNVSSDPHPVHTDFPALNLGDFPAGGSVSLTFTTPGTYTYHNHLNPSQAGSVTVQ
ncbi:hypothetical protein HYS82_02580 [Candidatus Amesbacteria bacterium]|nr:hypothetical protein [Candidatus Amesbacteria bacterium]